MHQDTETKSGERLLRLPDVESRTGLKKSAIYAGVKDKTFPEPCKLGPRAVAWPASAIDAWIAGKIASARGRQFANGESTGQIETRYWLDARPSQAAEGTSTREVQCKRAADYMEAHPGCTLRELLSGAGLDSASRVIREMERTLGYRLRQQKHKR